MSGAGPSQSQPFEGVQLALTERRFRDIAGLLDCLELEAAGAASPTEWPYILHLLGHVILEDLNSARFLWKRIPDLVKQSSPELQAAWKIVQALWQHDRPGVHSAVRGYTWSPLVQPLVSAIAEEYAVRMFNLLSTAYSSIHVDDAARVLGLSPTDAAPVASQRGWAFDPTANVLTTKKLLAERERKTDISHLQNLTDYVFQLEQ